jgi:phage shock protein E
MLIRTILKWYLPGLILGAVAGFFYWKFYGCDGTCLITSSPVRSMIYFGVMGSVVSSMFQPKQKEVKDKPEILNND